MFKEKVIAMFDILDQLFPFFLFLLFVFDPLTELIHFGFLDFILSCQFIKHTQELVANKTKSTLD